MNPATSDGTTKYSHSSSWFRSEDHLAIAALLLVFVAMVLVYSSVIPLFEGPDASAHFRYITYLRQQRQLPAMDAETVAISHELVQQPPFYYALTALLMPGSLVADAAALDVVNPFFDEGMSRRAAVSVPFTRPWAALPIYLARFMSALGGLLTVLGTWLLVRELLPHQPWAAVASASVVGLNPQFLFSASTITNDTMAAGLSVFAIWLAVHFSRPVAASWHWLWVGLIAGLAAITKYSGLLVLAPIGLVGIYGLRWNDWSRVLKMAMWCAIGFLVSAGFWYGRNLLLFGSLTPMDEILSLLPGLAREFSLPFSEVIREAKWLLRSYWGVYGYGIIAPAWYHGVVQNVLLMATAGLLILPVRTIVTRQVRPLTAALLALTWFAAVLMSLLNWIRIVLASNQGRLLFPAAPAVAILMVIGLQTWLPQRWQVWLHRTIPLLFLGLALSQIPVIADSYRLPPAIKTEVRPDRALDANFEGGMSVLGVDMPSGAAIGPGETLPLTVYFTARHQIDGFYTLFLHLSDDEDTLLYQFDGVAAAGRHATRQWRPGEVFSDTYDIRADGLNDLSGDALGTLSMGFYDVDDRSNRKAVLGAEENPVDDRVIVSPVRLHMSSVDDKKTDTTPVAEWQNGIHLASATIERDDQGVPQAVALEWRPSEVVHVDATVFVQVLDTEGQLIAQVDRKPLDGSFPTSTWRPGDVIDDTYTFTEPVDGWHTIIAGLYTADGRRLPLSGEDAGNHVVIVTSDE